MASSVVPNRLSEATNRFTGAVYKELIKNESGNIVFSPFAVNVILWLVYWGAEGESAAELATALHLSRNKEEIQNDTRDLLRRGSFDLIHLLFVQETLVLRDPFAQVAESHFSVTISGLDLTRTHEASVRMSETVERHTHHWQSKPMAITSLHTHSHLILGTALGVTLTWASPFSPNSTEIGTFFAPDRTIQVYYLQQQIRGCKYYESADFKANFLALPTYLNRLDMVFVLPTERNGLSSLEQRIDEIALFEIPFKSTIMKVSVPKFRFRDQIDFKKILTQLGVSKIFDPSQADLSGIAGNEEDIAVDQIAQNSYIDVNEGRSSLNVGTSYVHVKTFIADHPFIFLLKARETTILAGRVIVPTF